MALDEGVALISLDEVKDFINKSGDEGDERIEAIINEASVMVEKYCQRGFLYKEGVEEEHIGRGGEYLWLRRYPVEEVEEVKIINIESGEEEVLVGNDDYVVINKAGYVRRLWGVWGENERVIITYSGGYKAEEMPYDLRLAVKMLVASLYKKLQAKSWGEVSRSIAGQNVEWAAELVDNQMGEILKKYKSFGRRVGNV